MTHEPADRGCGRVGVLLLVVLAGLLALGGWSPAAQAADEAEKQVWLFRNDAES